MLSRVWSGRIAASATLRQVWDSLHLSQSFPSWMLLWKRKGGVQHADSMSSSLPSAPKGWPLRAQSCSEVLGSPRASVSLNWWQHFVPDVFYFDSSSAEPLEGGRNLTVQLRFTCHRSMWRRRRKKRPVWRQLKQMSFNKKISHPSEVRALPGFQAWCLRAVGYSVYSQGPCFPDLHILLFANYCVLQKSLSSTNLYRAFTLL